MLNLIADCIANSTYVNGEQVGQNSKISFSGISFKTIEAMGKGGSVDIPIPQLIDAMECTVSRSGLDKAFIRSIKPEAFDMIHNVVQTSTDGEGTQTPQQVKIFMRVVPKGIPGMDFTPGEQSERELSFSVYSVRVVVDGEEYFHADAIKGIMKVNGTDYYDKISSML